MRRYLYKITNLLNGKIYIGVHFSKRISDQYMGSGSAIKKAIKKYGKHNFTKEILEYFESDQAMFDREREVVNESFVLNSETYNLVIGGKGTGSGSNHPLFGKKRPDHSEFMKNNNPTKGKPRSQKVKDAVSSANKGRKYSQEINKKKGRSQELNHFFGKKGTALNKKWINNGVESRLVDLSQFTLDEIWKLGRISLSDKQVLKINPQTKQVIDEYPSLKTAGEINQISKNSISRCCAGKLKTAGGYIWKLK